MWCWYLRFWKAQGRVFGFLVFKKIKIMVIGNSIIILNRKSQNIYIYHDMHAHYTIGENDIVAPKYFFKIFFMYIAIAILDFL